MYLDSDFDLYIFEQGVTIWDNNGDNDFTVLDKESQ